MFKSFEIISKIDVDAKSLSMIYTPGVGVSCQKIAEDVENSWVLTNRINSIAVISTDYTKSLKRAIFLKDALQIDAYPFEISDLSQIKFVVENLEPSFKGFDLSLCDNLENISFDIELPVLTNQKVDLKDFFGTISQAQIKEIAEAKMPDLNCSTIESAMNIVAGQCRSMGVKVEE